MTRRRILAFISTLLLPLTIVGVVNLAVRSISRNFEPQLQRMLDMATEGGEVRIMEILILLGADVNGKVYPQLVCGNATEEDIATNYHFPLQSAAYGGHTEAVELLLDKGVSIAGADGRAVLWHAALGGHLDIARLLLARGADPKALSNQFPAGNSPLEEATQDGETEIAKLFLEYGAERNGELDSALWEAVWFDKHDTARFLISRVQM